MANPRISFFQPISHLFLHPFVLSLLAVDYLVLLFQLFLQLFTLFFQFFDNGVVSLFNVFDVGCVNSSDSFFDVVELKLVLPLCNVYFLAKHGHFSL